jgi:AAA domain
VSQEDVDRADELREWYAEDDRRAVAAASKGHTGEDIPPAADEPDDIDDHHAGEYSGTNNGHRPQNDADEQSGTDEDDDESAIRHRLQWLRVNHEARRRLDDENRTPVALPPVKSLTELLSEPDDATQYRIEGLAPSGGRIMLSAQYKAGKTTLRDNLVRVMVDGEPLFGRFAVNEPAEQLVLVDNELSDNTMRRWLRDQKIVNTSEVADVIRLRGRVGVFNLLDDRSRDQWAARLRDIGCDYLVLDCLRPVLDALGLSEDKDAGRFLVAFDALLDDAGIPDAAVVHHMGHASERSRGDSRLQDWPNAIWRIVRETDQPDSARYFSAYGRDVEVPEGRLSFDAATRRLTYSGGTRVNAKVEAAGIALISLLAECGEAMSGRGIEDALAGEEHSRRAIRDATAKAVKKELVAVKDGPHRSKLHSIAYPCSQCGLPVTSRRERHESCPTGPTSTEGLFAE